MRNNGVFVILTLAFVITISAIGDSPLSPPIDLAVEPISVPVEPSIQRAAQRNDFVTFDTLYKTADANGENVARWSELHRFWTWSMTDPVGGFYGPAVHDRFARMYPDYSSFIADYEIVDSRGNAFYPSAETRRFLLSKIGEAPRPIPVIAKAKPAPARVVPASGRPLVAAPKTAAVPKTQPVMQPIVRPQPVKAAETAALHEVTQPVPTTPARPGVGRGILLIIIGLIGIGVLTVMLHAPGDEPQNPHPGIT